MKKIKEIFKEWLGVTELEKEKTRLNEKMFHMQQQIDYLQRPDELARDFRSGIANVENLKRYFKIGLDTAPRGHESWCVICSGGKQEYVTFVDLNNKNMHDISMFLKQFQLNENNIIVDAPFNKRYLW